MKINFIAALLIAAGSLAAAEENLSGPLPAIQGLPFISRAQLFSPAPGQQAPLDLQIQNQMAGVGQIFVSCGFDGQNNRCLLDTGSYICIVDNDSFFGKYPAQGQSCSEGASGKKICSDIITVADLKVGAIDFGAMQAQRRGAAQSCGGSDSPQMPSYLVGSVWHTTLGHQVAFNFDAKTLTVDPAQPAPGGLQPMKLIADDTFLLLPVSFGGGAPVQMLYDTGAGLNVMDQSFVDANAGAFSFVADTQIQDSSCEKIPVKVYTINTLGVGGNSLSGAYAVAMDLASVKKALGSDVQGILGFNAITQYNWWVDLKNRQFSATPIGSASVASVTPAQIPQVLKIRLPSLLQR